MDIANGISIVKAIRQCKSVKPVVLVSYRSIGDRFEGLKNLTHLLAKLIPGIKDQIQAFSYLFTKYPLDERKTIHASLKNLGKTFNEQEKSDQSFMNLFADMLDKTESRTLVVDPIRDQPSKLLRELVNSATISNPSEVFELSITEKSKAIVHEQVRKYQLSLISAVERDEYPLIKYQLDQLRRLNDLLQQDSLQKIYTDCIERVSKHLSDQYQTGTTLLKTTLTHQTIVSVMDIEQYQTYLEHAYAAEQLRKDHLFEGKAIHSSAFVQYLNQQVVDIDADLREKQLDHLSIKAQLDKIKLLAEYFAQVRSPCESLCQYAVVIKEIYESLCQSFSEKIELKVKSFQGFVSANDFHECGMMMSSLAEALNQFRDHLDTEMIKTKLFQLRQALIKYLIDSVKALDDLLKKKVLEKVHIDQMNACLMNITKALATSTLDVHISKRELQPIHDDCLAKMVTFCENLIREIKGELKKEHHWNHLEGHIQQLDLIRTISSVAGETSQVYHSTLEELFGCILQLRRDVEELLRLLFQGGEKVDFEKLLKCLVTLKSVSWIENYRKGLYSKMIQDVEQLILEHVERLKQSIEQTNLDLGHAQEIKPVVDRLSNLHEMRHLDSFIPTINTKIEEIHTWFNTTIGEILKIIKNTFSPERCNEQGYRSLDSIKAEKAFEYLDACTQSSISMKAECASVSYELERFVRNYSDFVQKEMETSFDIIKTCNETGACEIFDRARLLANRLQEISDIEKTSPRVLSCFSTKTMVEDWQMELSSYRSELSNEMARLSVTQSTEVLNSKLTTSKALSKLDKFIDDRRYIDLYNEYQKVFFTQNDDIARQVVDAIKSFDYEGVAVKMLTLDSSSEVGKHFYREAKRLLTAGIDQLIEGTENQVIILGNSISLDDIKAIVDNFKRMERAKQFIPDDLYPPDKIDESIKNAKEIMSKRIKQYLVGVRSLIVNHNFYEADGKIDSITQVKNLLGKFCTKEISDEIESLNEYRDKVVLTNVDMYSQMDINSYPLNPPTDIFEKFKRVNQTNPVYREALDKIREKIFTKFREELDKAKSKQPPDSENFHIRRFESAVKYLPEAMKNALEVELKHCKDDIGQLIRDNESKLNNAFKSGDVRNIKIILLEYEKTQEFQSFASRVKALVLQQTHELVQKINENFERNEIREVFIQVKNLYNYKVELGELIADINRPYSEVRLRLIRIFDDAYLAFSNRFVISRAPLSESEGISTVEKTLMCLFEFIKFQCDHSNQTSWIHILPDGFLEKIDELILKVQDYTKEYRIKSDEALEKIDTDVLGNILKTMLMWHTLVTNIKVYYEMYINTNTLMNKIMISLEELAQHSRMLIAISKRIEVIRNEICNVELLNQQTKEFSPTRDEFYRKFNDKFLLLNRVKSLTQVNNQIDLDKIERDCLDSFEAKIKTISSNCEKLSHRVSQDHRLTRGEYEQFNLYYCNLISIRQEMKVFHLNIQSNIERIEEDILKKIQSCETSIQTDVTLSNVVNNLKEMKRIAGNVSSFRSKVNERIDEILKEYKSMSGVKAFAKLGTFLNQDKDGIAQSIIVEQKIFQGFSLSLFNEKTKKHGIGYVLNHIRGDRLDKDKIGRRYAEFLTIYEKLVEDHLRPEMKLDQFIADTKLIFGNLRQNSTKIIWDPTVRSQIPKLTAHIFSLWTLSKAEHYFDAEGLDDQKNYLVQPHAAQVVAIFRLLSIGDTQEDLINNLVEIRTGEGKSIVLAVTAVIFVLLGFDVHCACFSEYLSQRDYSAFLPLFESLETHSYIHYGTFNKLCEDMINENGDIRQTVTKLIFMGTNENKNSEQKTKRPKILFIDEVDVFFSRDFYGNVYTPSASVKDSTIGSIVNLIWTGRKSNLRLRKVQGTPEYRACQEKFPQWISLIDEAIKDMIADVQTFESHDYEVKNDQIGYIEQGNIVYNVIYGYKTLFAYHHEHQKGQISRESLEEKISIRINCGSFSYAHIPLQFQYIMGVTGTLETLSDPEKKVIVKDYRVSKNTYLPSVYGQNNLRFIEINDINIESGSDYFNRIKREIDDRLVGVSRSSEQRAVLVFFESKAKLMEFYQSPALESIRHSVVYLTEDALSQEKEAIISRATVSGQITLFTRTFGRGTDFICHDQVVATNGGTHVIQTFLSEELSEEKQIKGRTARQGDQGTYSLILLEHDLEKFHIDKSHIEDILKGRGVVSRVFDKITGVFNGTKNYDTLYDFLHDRRTEFFKSQYEENMKYVEQAKEKHFSSQKFLSNLRENKIEAVRKFLLEENRGAAETPKSRTVCLMDATGSMYHLLNKCKNTVSVMFERAAQILNDEGMDPQSFQLQFVVYRNYSNAQDKLLQSSSWETKPQNLRAFMNTIDVEGGMGNEAIEIGLWHANQEHLREAISQVILIGDAPPNTIDEVKRRRENFGQTYWKKTKFAEPTFYLNELERLIVENIPVHAFYVEQLAEEKFREIAKRSHGRCELLDINSSAGSDMLTDLVTEEILNNVGGQLKGQKLVKAYRKKFPKSYISAAEPLSPNPMDVFSSTRNPLTTSPISRMAKLLRD